MELSEVQFGEQPPIDGYGPGFFRIGGKVFEGAVLILPQGIYPWAGFGDWSDLIKQKDVIDLVFIGMGSDIAHLPSDQQAILDAADVKFEIMGSPAAARTYNVLLAEGRQVAAALLPIEK